ncbi:MAG: hypothetical protein ACE14S_10020 [Candidatus Bathyarchaeia archaeon]
MVLHLRSVKLWVAVSLASLFLYNLYWLVDSFIGNGYRIGFGMVVNAFKALFGIQVNLEPIWIAGHASSTVGLMVRFCELTLALYVAYVAFRQGKSLSDVRGKVSVVVLLEAGYFLCFLLPASMLLWLGQDVFAASYFLQILLVAPLLALLAVKVWRSGAGVWKYFALAFVGYVAATWVNNNSRWIAMTDLSPVQLAGFANGTISLTIALVFAAGWCLTVWRGRGRALGTRLFGLSLVMLGAHFLLYLAYTVVVSTLSAVMLVEVWAIPLLGLGAALLRAGSDAESLSA